MYTYYTIAYTHPLHACTHACSTHTCTLHTLTHRHALNTRAPCMHTYTQWSTQVHIHLLHRVCRSHLCKVVTFARLSAVPIYLMQDCEPLKTSLPLTSHTLSIQPMYTDPLSLDRFNYWWMPIKDRMKAGLPRMLLVVISQTCNEPQMNGWVICRRPVMAVLLAHMMGAGWCLPWTVYIHWPLL